MVGHRAGVAQWESEGLIIPRPWVRFPPPAPTFLATYSGFLAGQNVVTVALTVSAIAGARAPRQKMWFDTRVLRLCSSLMRSDRTHTSCVAQKHMNCFGRRF